MTVTANEVGRIPKADKKAKEGNTAAFAERSKLVVDESVNSMFGKLLKMREVLGKQSYRSFPVGEDELTSRYVQVRHDRVGLAQVLGDNVRVKDDGRVLLSRELVERMIDTEGKLRKGGLQ